MQGDSRPHYAKTEILDFGYPQTSETDTLKQYISQEEIRSDKLQVPTPCPPTPPPTPTPPPRLAPK